MASGIDKSVQAGDCLASGGTGADLEGSTRDAAL